MKLSFVRVNVADPEIIRTSPQVYIAPCKIKQYQQYIAIQP